MRKNRLKDIQKILSLEAISSQEMLLEKLDDMGYNITQATLSRDLAFLNVGKFVTSNKGYIYVLPQDLKKLGMKPYSPVGNFLSVLSIKISKNIVVINTISGYATQICVNIDDAKIPECIGTVAGDDTIIMVIDENVSKENFLKILFENFPELKDKI